MQPPEPLPARRTALRLLVRNHPGVMSHVCGLFARRAFNVEGILSVPIGDGARSAILLDVDEDARLPQVIAQLRKLEDVLDVRPAPTGREAFAATARFLE
ncbi:MAG TPA: ACT domain-containing protein [Candidatus Binatia bacterium]|jgi:acetolactate synthase-1/3 small subunit